MQVIKPIVDMKTKEISQMKPRLGQGRAGLRWEIKTLVSINKSIAQTMESSPHVLAATNTKLHNTLNEI